MPTIKNSRKKRSSFIQPEAIQTVLPLSCEPAAIRFLSACITPNKDQTSQRNPTRGNKRQTNKMQPNVEKLKACSTNRNTLTLLSSFLASISKNAARLSFISSAMIYNTKCSCIKQRSSKQKTFFLLPLLNLTVMVPCPAGFLFFSTSGRVSFRLDTT